ncbi:Glycine cleavage system H protein, mitochondrial [Symbiodinium microadriaticum]|uniref:Glycine cleavage system H protein, mitochondrial n=1 Tax=Symbiodinium microadriaticum TaxID=2951 RepID=A0A1Q9EGE0_SYMMI|nr:Glycine cleavage system H protein, mitochondrial [Symbiodinium microadriaticum]
MFRALLCTALLVQTRSWECPAGFAGPEKCLGKENAGKCELQKPSKVDIDTNNALSCGNPNAKLAEFETDLGGGSYYKGCGLNQDGLVDSCCNCWPLKEAASNEVKIVPISNAEDRPSAFDDDPACDATSQQDTDVQEAPQQFRMALTSAACVTSTGLGEWVITRFWSPGHLENLECHFFRNFANSPLPGYIEVQALAVDRRSIRRLDRFSICPRLLSPLRAVMSSTGAGFVDVVVADLVAPPTSKSATSASPLEASPAPGEIGENAGQPTMGAQAGGIAGSPSTGTSALVETAVADEDPVMGVPPSSDEEEELLADVVGAQHFPGVDVVDGEAQTVHFTPILAFDAHDVGVQTANEVMFSSFVGDIVCRRPPATDFAIPAGRQGGPGGLWHQEPESPTAGAGTQHLGRLPVPAPRTGADLRHKEIPYSVVGWTADTWEEAERLEAAIASGASTPPQSVSAGVILRSLPPNVRGGRLPRERPADFTKWIGWCFVKCPDTVGGGLAPTTHRCWAAPTSTTSATAVHRRRRGSASTRLKFRHHGPASGLVCGARRTGRENRPVRGAALARPGWSSQHRRPHRPGRQVGGRNLALEAMLAAPPLVEESSTLALVGAGPSRPDLPVRRDATRASLAAAVEAVRPANVKRAPDLEPPGVRGQGPRLAHLYPDLSGDWRRLSGRRVPERYFLAAFRYQEHDLGIRGGIPPALAPLVNFADRAAFDPARAAHSADVFVIAVWFMLREIEVAAARVSDMVVSPGLAVRQCGTDAAPGRPGHAWASDEQEFFAGCTRPWLHGFHSPGGQRWVVCPRALRVNDRYARAASDDDPMFGCILDADIPEFEPPHRVLEWPVVPTGDYAYNAKLLDGKPRQFPTRRLAGADAVLSRIYHEHTVSKAYTPLLLGEILSARTWTSADELNKLAAGGKEPSGGALHIVAGTVVAAWEPRGVMAMPDRPRDQEHTRALLDELVAETRLGRVTRPCAAPDHWSVSTVALPSVADMGVLRQPPPGLFRGPLLRHLPGRRERRAEASPGRGLAPVRPQRHHGASDVPTHHFLDAYRQWAVRHPGHCGTFLPSAAGVTLWFHFAMCFGAAASVWNFNRAADAVQMLLRSLLLVLLGHFVDDFNGVDAADLADSAHHAVADFFALLGLQTKPSKAQAPAKRHVVQGVELSIRPEGVELSPTAQRTQKILGQIDDALARDSLSPDEASRLAGRLTFLSQSTFGATGRAAIKPLYSRAADTAANSDDTLSVGLRLVASHRPRLVPWPGRVTGPFPVLYADAFFLDGDLRKKPGHLAAGEAVPKAARWQNGCGYVLLLDGHVFYDYGVIKPEHLAPFAARKAFIYVLEIVAQVLPLVTFARRLSPFWIAFIDNVAGQFALMKGYGKDPSVNGILASFWGLASDRQWAPDFHRVPSESNVSGAISRGDDSRARAEGWTRLTTPVDDIMDVLARAASDIDFACHVQALAVDRCFIFTTFDFVNRPAPAYSGGAWGRAQKYLRREESMGIELARLTEQGQRYFTKTHEWFQVEEEGVGTVGITQVAQRALGEVLYCKLPQEGARFKVMETLATLEALKSVGEVHSPIRGEVIEVNSRLEREPALVTYAPLTDGWLVRMAFDGQIPRYLRRSSAIPRSQVEPLLADIPGLVRYLEERLLSSPGDSDALQELTFDGLRTIERWYIHKAASELNLYTASHGTGAGRQLVVRRAPRTRNQPGPDADEDSDDEEEDEEEEAIPQRERPRLERRRKRAPVRVLYK